MSTEIVWLALDQWAGSEQRAKLEAIWSGPQFNLVCQALKRLKLQPLLVGGVVRDLLLNRENKDVDLIINCSPNKLMKMGKSLGKLTSATAVPLDRERGTLRLCFSPDIEVDLVSLQGESLWHDLYRRDLRINAMAIDTEGRLADPTSGRADLAGGVLREIRSENFKEDPLRTIRALRFAAQLGFTLEPATLQSAAAAVPGLAQVAGERIKVELAKFFDHARPGDLKLLQRMGVVEAIQPLEAYDWATLRAAAANAPVGLRKGVAVLFGPSLDQTLHKPLFERLKLSREEQRYLSHWWKGAALLSSLDSVMPRDVFRLSRAAGTAFHDLAASVKNGPWKFAPAEQSLIEREARGEGILRWDSPPWSGEDLRRALDRPAGPWLGQALRELEEKWALKEIESLQEAVGFLRT